MQDFIETLHVYDYILFALSGSIFLTLLFLAILIRDKIRPSLLLILLSFIILIAGPIIGYQFIHSTLYKTKISELSIKKLEFSQAVVIKGILTNLGKQSFKKCKISSSAYKGANNFVEEIIFPLKPFIKESIVKDDIIDINDSIKFKLLLEPFTYTNEYNISIKVNCI
ncbi:MAG TPA: DUF2393 domain-containing protein [Sulfurimonas sp.]|nr:DUF2393 domain-containing protein [Sulfurimonas sp.]